MATLQTHLTHTHVSRQTCNVNQKCNRTTYVATTYKPQLLAVVSRSLQRVQTYTQLTQITLTVYLRGDERCELSRYINLGTPEGSRTRFQLPDWGL